MPAHVTVAVLSQEGTSAIEWKMAVTLREHIAKCLMLHEEVIQKRCWHDPVAFCKRRESGEVLTPTHPPQSQACFYIVYTIYARPGNSRYTWTT